MGGRPLRVRGPPRRQAGKTEGNGRARTQRVYDLAPGIAPAAARKAAILAVSLTPGARSTPDDTSTAGAPVRRTASATFAAVRPPDSIQGSVQRRPAVRRPSKTRPLPPRRALARRGGRPPESRRS